MIIQFIFGWPGIIIYNVLATIGAWKPDHRLTRAALIVALPSMLYLLGGNGWVQLMSLYILTSLLVSGHLIKRKQLLAPKLLLLPVYGFYLWLAIEVLTQ